MYGSLKIAITQKESGSSCKVPHFKSKCEKKNMAILCIWHTFRISVNFTVCALLFFKYEFTRVIGGGDNSYVA